MVARNHFNIKNAGELFDRSRPELRGRGKGKSGRMNMPNCSLNDILPWAALRQEGAKTGWLFVVEKEKETSRGLPPGTT
ncbi:hypothetical protein MJ581_05840 [Escherichia coli]|nr:hypothetical protein MJ581_05840 [Escherichia coli]